MPDVAFHYGPKLAAERRARRSAPELQGSQIDWHIGDHRRSDIRQFTSVPCFHLLSHRLKVSPHSVNANRDVWNGLYGMDDGMDLI
jgi:hypothetical protein